MTGGGLSATKISFKNMDAQDAILWEFIFCGVRCES